MTDLPLLADADGPLLGAPEHGAGAIRVRLRIREDLDVVIARKHVRDLSLHIGLSQTETEALATAVSEIARNIVIHAIAGEVLLQTLDVRGRCGVVAVARDHGPGIADTRLAMQDGYSTVKSLGFGLGGAQRLVDEFELVSAPAGGTTVVLKKWRV